MFSLFKRKQNLTPKDVSNGILTSNFAVFKIGEKLAIPENIVCFVRYKDKTYKEILSGEHALNKEMLLDLYTKQLKGKEKIKSLKADLYFVNLSLFNFEFEFVDKIPLNKVKEKFLINVKLNIQVEDAELFLKSFIYENNAPTAETTKNLLIEFAESCLRKHFLRKSLNSTLLNGEHINQINSNITKHFKKLGLNANVINVDLFKKANKNIKKEDNLISTLEEPDTTKTTNTQPVDASQKEDEINTINTYTEQNMVTCPNCNSKLIKGSIFCHKCGYRK